MKAKTLLVAGSTTALLLCQLGSVTNAESTYSAVDPMAAYIYDIPANSWYAAKIKPKMKARPETNSGQVYIPPANTSGGYADNNPAAYKPEPMQALPFWNDIPVTQ